MKLVIATQVEENYGAHDWDGEGTCPQYWKAKGGSEYIIENLDPLKVAPGLVINTIRGKIESNSEYYREYILAWSLESDDYMSWFEISQLEHDGVIQFREPRLTIDGERIPA